jgi:hypothetical protein
VVRAIVVGLLLALAAAPVAAQESPARTRPRIIWDVPPDRVVRIATVGPGQSVQVDVPFHTTGDLENATVVIWSRGIVAGVVGPRELGAVLAFTPRQVHVRIDAPGRIPPGPYSMTVQIEDRATDARDIFRTTVFVGSEVVEPPAPTAPPRATTGWGVRRPRVRPSPPPRIVTGQRGERALRLGVGFVRP